MMSSGSQVITEKAGRWGVLGRERFFMVIDG
jgi:hypothetical protein